MSKNLKRKEEREVNLGVTKETIHLIYVYRMLKFLAKSIHRDIALGDLEPLALGANNKDVQQLKSDFIEKTIALENSPLFDTEELFHSSELRELIILYDILKNRDLLVESIAEISYRQINKTSIVDVDAVKELSDYLRYYLSHPEVMLKYKEYNMGVIA